MDCVDNGTYVEVTKYSYFGKRDGGSTSKNPITYFHLFLTIIKMIIVLSNDNNDDNNKTTNYFHPLDEGKKILSRRLKYLNSMFYKALDNKSK